MESDIQIAQEAEILHISEIAKTAGIDEKYLDYYGKYKAKIDTSIYRDTAGIKDGKLILVTAINPTPAGEGKTTTSIGLADALKRRGKKVMLALREPSLGPVFGLKGGAAGGGYSQVIPMEDINLHFTGDIHAITAANNLIAAMLDNHIHHGGEPHIDVRRIVWKRCMDINDRQLRNIVCGLGGKANGVPREDGFDISVASEIMAVLCLASGLDDLSERIGRIIVAYDQSGAPVTAADIKAQGAACALLKDALKPNLVQTLEHTPALVHGGPFANIAHGCNSVMATRLALKCADYVVTEAGFGADLGAQKFIDIKCRQSGIRPDAAVIVATARALKMHGGMAKSDLDSEDLASLERGIKNLEKHIENMKDVYGLPVVVAVNRFPSDTDRELKLIEDSCVSLNTKVKLSEVWAKGGEGGLELADGVLELLENERNSFRFSYADELTIKEKIESIAVRIYGADGVIFSGRAKKELQRVTEMGFDRLPVCIAKTQYSLSDDASRPGRPSGFSIEIREVRISAGAGFIVAFAGNILTMPGLPEHPAAEGVDVDAAGVISGLF